MGHGIAQVFAMAGFPVDLYDPNSEMLATAGDRIRESLVVFQGFGLIDGDGIDGCLDRISPGDNLEAACREAGIVIEAAPERLAFKRELFGRIEGMVPRDTILCTNTSALSITDISTCLKYPARFLGTHFWNPAQIVPCVEVIKGRFTSEEVFEGVVDLLGKVGKEPVRVLKDIPGFLGNRLQHALQREALALVEEGVAEPEEVDRVVKSGFGLRYAFMGPFERADLGGLDTTCKVQEYLLPFLDRSTTPSPLLAEKNRMGDLGLKTGRGFYDWTEEHRMTMARERDRVLLSLIQQVKKDR